MNSVDKLFNKIENHIQLKLDGFDSLISEGKIYLNEKKFCENKKHLLEIIKDRNKWENRVNKFLQKIENDKFTADYLLELEDILRQIFDKGMEKVNKKGKSEIVSVSIGGENIKLNDVLNRINYFEKNVDECYTFTINGFLNDIEDDVNKFNREYEVWIDMYESLTRELNSLINMKEDVVRIRDEFLHN